MKVALCLYGQPRNVENLKVFHSHFNWILSKYDTDVFCHAWYKENYNYEGSFINISGTFHKESINLIKNYYNPKELVVDEPRQFDISIFDRFLTYKENSFLTEQRINNTISQMYSINMVNHILQTYIDANNIKYDYIIVARYDIIINSFPDMYTLDKDFFYNSNHHHGFPDLFFIFNPIFIKSQLIYDNLDLILNIMRTKPDTYWECSCECIKFHAFLLHYDKNLIKSVDIRDTRNEIVQYQPLPIYSITKSIKKIFNRNYIHMKLSQ